MKYFEKCLILLFCVRVCVFLLSVCPRSAPCKTCELWHQYWLLTSCDHWAAAPLNVNLVQAPLFYSSVSQPLWDRGPVNSFFIRRGSGPNRFTRKYLSIFFLSSRIKLTQVLIINYGIIIKSISTLMYTVWHVDKYKITFKLVIRYWTNEILQHIVVSSGQHLGLSFLTHSRIFFFSEYFQYKTSIHENCLDN